MFSIFLHTTHLWYDATMLTYLYRESPDAPLQTLQEMHPGVWIHADQPSERELDAIALTCGIERDMLTDACDPYEVPRFEHEDNFAYFFTRFPHEQNGELHTEPILIVVGPEVIVTITNTHPAFMDAFLAGKHQFATNERTRFFLTLIATINTSYQKNLILIQREIQRSRVRLTDIHNKDILRFVGIEITLNEFANALSPTQNALRIVSTSALFHFGEEGKDAVEDIQLENQQIVETAKANLKTIQNIRSSYTAIMTNNLNSVIKLLTAFTVIMTIPTVLGSLYGMNVPLPLAESPKAFIGIVTMSALAMLAITFLFVKKKWL